MVSLCIQASAGREMIFIGCVHIYLHPFTTLARIPFIATVVAIQIAKIPGKYVYRFSRYWGPLHHIENMHPKIRLVVIVVVIA